MEFLVTESGLSEVSNYLSSLALSLPLLAESSVRDMSLHAAERSRENAPIWKNRLRPAIQTQPIQNRGNAYLGGVRVHSSIFWASLMHAQLQPYGSGPYNLGPVSRVQPSTPEGGVGGKFITRVIEAHKISYERELAASLMRLLQTGRVSKLQL